MKCIIQIVLILCVLFSTKAKSQNDSVIQNINHPTIASVKFKYKAVPQASLNENQGEVGIQSIPEGLVTFKQNFNVAKIYLKIINLADNSILYQVNYQTNSSTVTNNENKKLFENNNGAIFISNGSSLMLKPYKYEIRTENAEGNLSPVYSVTQ